MIEIKQLTQYFNKGEANEIRALNNCDLQIKNGELVVIVGANGSGKSTLLNMIAGDFVPSKGTIAINGTDVSKLPAFKRSKWVSRIFQDPLRGTAANLSLIENFRLAALRTQSKKLKVGNSRLFRQQVADQLCILDMGLEHKLEQPVGTFSGGQRQALTLLMSAMDKSAILLLDEPTAALDPKSAHKVMALAETLVAREQLTALLVTHNLQDAARYGTRLLHMNGGAIVKDYIGEAKAVLSAEAIFHWFL